ncbi:biliverdin-producing heme oxygenase [Aquimarina brevivitae]|uniref:Heme oxygenase n=1 Tax=Aquimarina brevivitae TaxID=323412 RepID=A0A4Q7PI29_9FLAO|nr:biliverdin-producing heme oxygenase [Aquimarina brevivitae]RZS99857.1 heme oxygenase [Aquimarina brevivitae]
MIAKLLKEKTAEAHKNTESNNSAKYIIDHSITKHQYTRLLLANYNVYSVVEEKITQQSKHLPVALHDFISSDKSNRLERDLLNAGVTNLHHQKSNDVLLEIAKPMQAIGAMYVIEGSMLGGIMIANHLEHCKALRDLKEHHFFGGDPKIHIQRWKKFVNALDSLAVTETELHDIITGANATFQYFDRVFLAQEAY